MAKDAADIATVAHVRTIGADTDNVIGRGDVVAGKRSQRRVEEAGGVAAERNNTIGRVVVAGGVEIERRRARGCVVVAGGVRREGNLTNGRVAEAGGVGLKCANTDGRVLSACREKTF